MQHVSMLDQPCQAQSERSESAVLDLSARRSQPEIAFMFEKRAFPQQRICLWPNPPIRAAEAGSGAMTCGNVVLPMVTVLSCTVNQFSVAIHLPPIEGAQPEFGGAQ